MVVDLAWPMQTMTTMICPLPRKAKKKVQLQPALRSQSTHTITTKVEAENNGRGSSTTDDNYDEQSLLNKEKANT